MTLQKVTLSGCLFFMPFSAVASCLGSGDTEIESLAQDIGRQPHQALQSIEQALNSGSSYTVEQRAWLEAARAQAKRMTGMERSELPQAIEAAQSLPADHPALLHLQIANLYNSPLTESTREIFNKKKQILAQLPVDEASTLCSTIRLASVMADYNDLNGESFELASTAYRLAEPKRFAWMRAEAASILGQVVLRIDSSYGRQLSDEALSYFESQDMHDMAANELFMKALSWSKELETESLQKAEQHFRRSMVASEQANNPVALAYAEAGLCEVVRELGQVQEALKSCKSSIIQLKNLEHITNYSAVISYATALLADNRPTEALEQLAPLPLEWSKWNVGYHGHRFLTTRGRAFAALGNEAGAIDDLTLAIQALREDQNSAKERSNRLFQSRFRVEQLEQNLELRTRESEERKARNRIFITAGLIVMALLSITVFTLIKHRLLYKRLAFTDPLTGAANRRYFEERAQEAITQARARQQSLCLALLDLDYFKSCNDIYGHDAGDEALKRFVHLVQTELRSGDIFGRWGGEEFLLMLQGIKCDDAATILERLREAAAAVQLKLSPDYQLRFSAGIVEFKPDIEELSELVNLADQALYRAKKEGRNRSCFAD